MAHSIEVVFRVDVRGIAKAGDKKSVSQGFARNYLFPQQLAFPSTEGSLKQWETERQGFLARAEHLRTDAESLGQKIAATTLTLTVKASSEGKLFGSVTRQDIADLLKEKGITIDKKAILLKDPIKTVGQTIVPIQLHADIQSTCTVTIVSDTPVDAAPVAAAQ